MSLMRPCATCEPIRKGAARATTLSRGSRYEYAMLKWNLSADSAITCPGGVKKQIDMTNR